MSSVVQCQLEVIRKHLQPEATAPGTRTTTIWCSRSRPGNHSLLLGLQREHSKTEYGVLRVSLDTMVHWLFGKILCTVCLVFFFYKYVWSSFCFLLHLKTKTKNLTALFLEAKDGTMTEAPVLCVCFGGYFDYFFLSSFVYYVTFWNRSIRPCLNPFTSGKLTDHILHSVCYSYELYFSDTSVLMYVSNHLLFFLCV